MNFRPEQVAMLLLLLGAFSFPALFAYLRFKRAQLRHLERLAALERGVALPFDPPAPQVPLTSRYYLLRGLLWVFAGAGLSLAMTGISLSTNHPPTMMSKLWMARDARLTGASEEQVNRLMVEMDHENQGLPYPVAMVGLIPMGVGIAYLIFYRKESQVAPAPDGGAPKVA